jgi:uncharacterized membrane protein YfhO
MKVNTALRGVYLTKGSHEVRFVYNPKNFYYGAWISALSLLGLVVFFGIKLRPAK